MVGAMPPKGKKKEKIGATEPTLEDLKKELEQLKIMLLVLGLLLLLKD